MRHTWVLLGVLVASQSAGAASQAYVDFINGGDDSVVSIELATPGGHDWRPVKLRGVVDGGYVSLAGGYIGRAEVGINTDRGCVYDILVQFAVQRALLVKGFDVCHTHSLDIGRTWRQVSAIS
jgi:hypothetical protein